MSIVSQGCSIVVLAVVIYFYTSCKKVFLNTDKTFFLFLISSLVSVIFDTLSIISMYLMDHLPLTVVHIMSRLYLVSIVAVAQFGLAYVLSDIHGRGRKYKIFRYSIIALMSLVAIAIMFLPIEVVTEEGISYTQGNAVVATYIFALAFLLLTISVMIKYSNIINRNRRNATIIWMALWLVAALVQYFFPTVIIVSFAISMGILIIYIKLENPESAIDTETGLFNQNTFRPYITQRFMANYPFSIFMLTFKNKVIDSGKADYRKKEVINYLGHIEKAYSFMTNEEDIYVVFDTRKASDEVVEKLKKRYISDNKEKIRMNIAYLPYSGLADNMDDMLHMLRFTNNSQEMAEQSIVVIDEEFKEKINAVKKVEKMINDAIDNNRIEVYYQPIYSTEKKMFTSAEALVRLRDEKGDIIPPSKFIEISEQNGTILKIGEVVFENVCKLISSTDIVQYGLEYIEVNLSVVQCEYEDLAKEFIEIMRKYGVPGDMINLEITETATLASKNKLINNMVALRNYGVGFSLDDFGTGQSNLNYIVDMPVDIVKFDRGMTTAYFESKKAQYVMDAAMHMIHGMKLDIVSEGIETKEQLGIMEKLGIQYIQGYFFSKPLPQDKYLDFIHESNRNEIA